VDSFFSYYTIVGISIVLLVGWKVVKKTKFIKPHEADLLWERPIVDAYEESSISQSIEFWTEVLQLVGIGVKKNRDRRGSIEFWTLGRWSKLSEVQTHQDVGGENWRW